MYAIEMERLHILHWMNLNYIGNLRLYIEKTRSLVVFVDYLLISQNK